MGRGAESTEEMLGAEEGEVVLDGEDLGLRVKMALGGHLQRPSAIRMGEFWTLWSLRTPEDEVLLNQMGAE